MIPVCIRRPVWSDQRLDDSVDSDAVNRQEFANQSAPAALEESISEILVGNMPGLNSRRPRPSGVHFDRNVVEPDPGTAFDGPP